MPLYIKVFLALGGVGIILKAVSQGVGPAVKAGIHWAIGSNHPTARKFVLDNRAWFEGVFDEADKAAKDALEEEAGPDLNPETAPKP